jgi:hypothetical protein
MEIAMKKLLFLLFSLITSFTYSGYVTLVAVKFRCIKYATEKQPEVRKEFARDFEFDFGERITEDLVIKKMREFCNENDFDAVQPLEIENKRFIEKG